jgi:hypothetical protein
LRRLLIIPKFFVNFDLYIYDSWDGSDGGFSPDFLTLPLMGLPNHGHSTILAVLKLMSTLPMLLGILIAKTLGDQSIEFSITIMVDFLSRIHQTT